MENHIKKFPGALKPEDCARQQGHRAAVFWLTGLSGSGKSTIAHAVEKKLFDLGGYSKGNLISFLMGAAVKTIKACNKLV